MKRKITVTGLIKVALILAICSFSIFPILWCLSTSLKPESQIYSMPPKWIPETFTDAHYAQILKDPNMLHYFKNTVILATGTTSVTMGVSVLAA